MFIENIANECSIWLVLFFLLDYSLSLYLPSSQWIFHKNVAQCVICACILYITALVAVMSGILVCFAQFFFSSFHSISLNVQCGSSALPHILWCGWYIKTGLNYPTGVHFLQASSCNTKVFQVLKWMKSTQVPTPTHTHTYTYSTDED